MKNTIKMSLVAALAVAGLSTTASAGGLEEAIKGVTISGKMEVEYDYVETKDSGLAVPGTADGKSTDRQWDIDWDMTAKVPVNDMVTAVFGVEGDTESDTNGGVTGGALVTGSAAGSNAESTINITKTYFQYANGPVTALVGKQGMAGAPWFDDERGNGVVGLYNAGPVTLAAAHFTNNNSLGNANITALAAIASVGPVNAQLWYAELSGLAGAAGVGTGVWDADSFAILADATFDIVNVGVKYAQADYDLGNPVAGIYNQGNDDAEMLQVLVSADFGVAKPYAGYGATDSKQGGAGLDLTGDTDSTLDFGSEQLSIDDLDNADAFLIGVTVPVGAVTIDASYVWGDYDSYFVADKDAGTAYACDLEEFLVQVDYKMSKNFTIGAHFSDSELEYQTSAVLKDKIEVTNAAVSLEYKF